MHAWLIPYSQGIEARRRSFPMYVLGACNLYHGGYHGMFHGIRHGVHHAKLHEAISRDALFYSRGRLHGVIHGGVSQHDASYGMFCEECNDMSHAIVRCSGGAIITIFMTVNANLIMHCSILVYLSRLSCLGLVDTLHFGFSQTGCQHTYPLIHFT